MVFHRYNASPEEIEFVNKCCEKIRKLRKKYEGGEDKFGNYIPTNYSKQSELLSWFDIIESYGKNYKEVKDAVERRLNNRIQNLNKCKNDTDDASLRLRKSYEDRIDVLLEGWNLICEEFEKDGKKLSGHRTRAPSKKPIVKVNVRKMF